MTPNFSYIKRDLERAVKLTLNKGKVIILYGPRQAGKTTLLKNLFKTKKVLYLSCEQKRIKEQLIPDVLALKSLITGYDTIIFDEAQYLDNPGLILKVAIDNFPKKNFIASGSSSFDLANKLSEPLTGRHYKFLLFPLSLKEISAIIPSVDRQFYLSQIFLFGSYPEVFKTEGQEEKIRLLSTLTDDYLYKDVLTFNLVKNSQKVKELLIAIALQVGNEVSYSELANTISVDRKTVEYYLDLLEKSFVIFRLYGFSRSLRSEINRKIKIFFYDLGIRNSLINNFNPLTLRNDAGFIFENFVISEIVKKEVNKAQKANLYFWRTYEKKEIDLIMEKNNKITAYEIKLKKEKEHRPFLIFKKLYPLSQVKIITLKNLFEEIV